MIARLGLTPELHNMRTFSRPLNATRASRFASSVIGNRLYLCISNSPGARVLQILNRISNSQRRCTRHVLATLLQNQELLDDLSTKKSRNLLTLAQGIGATPWPIEESDDEVDEAELQVALEASKKADNVVSFSVSSSSGTVSLPVLVSPSLVSSLPSAVVCSNMPSSSCVTSVAASICFEVAPGVGPGSLEKTKNTRT
nr:hypothetical protein Iba_chr13dCG4020 [Ipomoea batatas]